MDKTLSDSYCEQSVECEDYLRTFCRNKCQGQSLATIRIDLGYPGFSHGQFYVAVSRARKWGRVQILLGEQEIRNETTNIVYK